MLTLLQKSHTFALIIHLSHHNVKTVNGRTFSSVIFL